MFYLCNVKHLSIPRVAEMCHISHGSVSGIGKERIVSSKKCKE